MENPIESLSDVLKGVKDIDIAIGDTGYFVSNTNELSKYTPVLRALVALKENKIMDFCGHFRQCMNDFTRGFEISEKLYQEIFSHKDQFGLVFQTRNGYSVNIIPEILSNESDLKSTFKLEKRRVYQPSVADGRLYRYFEYLSYTSLSQKMLMYLIQNMRDSETLLACLPTGSGKSLSWQLPAISNTYSGLIIVIVPTVALAINHENACRNLYNSVFGADNPPRAYYSELKLQQKSEILNLIDTGILPILFISPEALQYRDFKECIMSAANKNKVSALIIDEAHLIVDWGIHFRPEFQLLSSFRNKLKEKSKIGIRTILLSGTLTPEDTEIIRNVYSDEIFTEFRADELRPEPSYYFHKCTSEAERISLVSQLVCQAPRPTIVYTVGPEEGEKYFNAIKALKFENVALFTGETQYSERHSLINEWDQNRIDIMVATSAFGMGVDKPDIRTIITAYTPESINRFYQEVGRAGRDGYAALNYFLPFSEIDKEYVGSLTKSKVISVEKLVKRWKELLAESEHATPDTIWIDINIPPEHLKFMRTGKQNAGWNKDVVLLLFRAGLLNILDVETTSHADFKVLVQLKNIRILEDQEALARHIADFRERERERVRQGVDSVKELMDSKGEHCYSRYLTEHFPHSETLCNGCPYCRKREMGHFFNAGRISIYSTKERLYTKGLPVVDDMFMALLHGSRSLMILTDGVLQGGSLCDCIEYFVKCSVNIIITPKCYDSEKLLEKLSYYDFSNYLILSLEEALKMEVKWLNGVCALLYTDSEEENQQLYGYSVRYLAECSDNKVVHIAPTDQFIRCEMRPLRELVEQRLKIDQLFSKEDI